MWTTARAGLSGGRKGRPMVAASKQPLLTLSRLLVGSRQEGVLADALDLLLAGMGASRGAVYEVIEDGIEIVGYSGLPAALRGPIAQLTSSGERWFIAQRAAHTRSLVVEQDLARTSAGRLDHAVLALSGWSQAAACPIAVGRELFGVVVVAAPAMSELSPDAMAVLEIGCNCLALRLGLRAEEQRHRGPSSLLRAAASSGAPSARSVGLAANGVGKSPRPPPAPPSSQGSARAAPAQDPRTAPTDPAVPAVRLADPASLRSPEPPSSDRFAIHRSEGTNDPPRRVVIAVADESPDTERRPSNPGVMPGDFESPEAQERESWPGVPSARDGELTAIAQAMAEQLRRDGSKRGSAVIGLLRERGLSETEALSVTTFAISTGLIVRDPPWSTYLKAVDPPPDRTVLIVDDDLDLRNTLREVLEDQGYKVETAINGREALDHLRRGRLPRVVVLDLMMPVMDGWQLIEEMKQDPKLARLPVLVISAAKKPGLNLGDADGVLSKPLDLYDLVVSIERSAKTPAHLP